MDALSQLFYLHGIGYEYTKYTGEHVIFSEDTRKSALHCCGVDTRDTAQITQLNYQLDAATWLTLAPAVSIIDQASNVLKVRVNEADTHHKITLTVAALNIKLQFEHIAQYAALGEYFVNGCRYIEIALPLTHLPTGYYDALLTMGEQSAKTQIWSTPEQAYQIADKKRFGLSIQLYTLKNKAGLGIGDFSDLLELATLCAKQNMDYILLNPLHLLFADNPECASPYNPNNRALLNPLYIAINLSPDSFNNPDLTKLLSANTSSKYSDQGVAFIDYKTVTECKYAAFKLLFKHFQQQGSQARQNEFSAFCKQYSDVLALLETTEPTFEYYLQWQAHSQLTQCQQHCIAQGMAIGLINDLAVGCANEGTEFKYQQGLFSQDATLGAPPDPWAPNGQNWGLPAINPQRLADNNYQFYRSLIRANMDAVGGLRIDHVMAIRRLWWCFINNNTQDGCYVYYPFEHLLAILKIESHLNQAIVIGEDLGVVPPEVKEALVDSGIFSNSLFYFEKQQNDEFVNSDDLSDQCLLMIANHDVPPFVGWWQHSDLKIKQQYGLIDTDEYQQLVQQREQEQHRLLRFLNPQNTSFSLNTDAFDVYSALAVCLAKSPSRLFALQLDDLDKQHYPVNIPGTDKEYPNWRRVLTHTCDDIFKDNAALLAAIHSIRNA